MEQFEKLTYSMISEFEKCKKKFKYTYILEVPAKISPHMFFGSCVHKVIEETYGMDITLGDLKDKFRKICYKERELAIQQYSYFLDKETETTHGKNCISMLEKYYNRGIFPKPEMKESFIKAQVDKYNFIAKVDNYSAGKILDFKTGKLNKRYLDWFQMETYAYILHINNYPVHYISYYFLLEDEILNKKIDDMNKIEDIFFQKIFNFRKETEAGNFEKTESKLCPYCDYLDLCNGEAEHL